MAGGWVKAVSPYGLGFGSLGLYGFRAKVMMKVRVEVGAQS